MEKYREVNIAITPMLMQFAREDGHLLGGCHSIIRTMHGESWQEWFLVRALTEDVIATFLKYDHDLHLDEPEESDPDLVIIRNNDPRLTIELKPYYRQEYEGTGVTIYYKPHRTSLDR